MSTRVAVVSALGSSRGSERKTQCLLPEGDRRTPQGGGKCVAEVGGGQAEVADPPPLVGEEGCRSRAGRRPGEGRAPGLSRGPRCCPFR